MIRSPGVGFCVPVALNFGTKTLKKLLLIAHAPSENTKRLADCVLAGANSNEVLSVETRWIPPLQTQAEHVIESDAIILGTTENLGYMSGALKDFFDRCYYPCLEKTEALPFAFYVRAGLDGTGTRRAIESISTGLKWKLVQKPLICKGQWQESFCESCEELGLFMAMGLDADIF